MGGLAGGGGRGGGGSGGGLGGVGGGSAPTTASIMRTDNRNCLSLSSSKKYLRKCGGLGPPLQKFSA